LMAAFIEIRDVEKRYATRSGPQVALRPTSLGIAGGGFGWMGGPAGAGQPPPLRRWRPVLDNVLLPAAALRRPRARYEPVARDLIRLVGLEGFANHYPRELSGGMQQRAALRRAPLLAP